MPIVNDPVHAQLIADLESRFHHAGWITADAGYERIYGVDVKQQLSECDAIPFHYLRTRSDRVAFHPGTQRILWFDAKTCGFEKNNGFAIEAIPFLRSCVESSLGIDYVFFCKRRKLQETYAVKAGVDAVARITKAVIGWRRESDPKWREWIVHAFKLLDCKAFIPQHHGGGRGSGDPWVDVDVDGNIHNFPPCPSIDDWFAINT